MTKRRTASVTRRGSALIVVGVVQIAIAFLFGIDELYLIGVSAFVLVGGSRVWVRRQSWELLVTRQVQPSRVPAGVESRVELTARNIGRSRCPALMASDPYDGGKRWARFAIAPLNSLETRTASYRLPTSKRGVFQLGPLELELGDPFGLVRTVTTATPKAFLTVHPRIDPISSRPMSARSDRDARLPLPVLGRGGDEFYALRDYENGDDLRLVHWPSSARVDDLIVRQPENLWRGRVTVAVDLRSSVHTAETLEQALSAAASITTAAIQAGLHVRLVTTGGIDTRFGSTSAQAAAILDALAAANAHPGPSLADGLRRFRGRDPFTLITTDAASDGDVALACRLGGASESTLIVFERRASGLEIGEVASVPGRYLRVPAGRSFFAVWEGARI